VEGADRNVFRPVCTAGLQLRPFAQKFQLLHNSGENFVKGNFKKANHHHHHHHHISVMELGHLLTRSGLTYPEVSSKVYHDSFCQLGSSISLP